MKDKWFQIRALDPSIDMVITFWLGASSRQDLDKNFNNMIEKAKVIQNLLDISNGDGRVMAQYVEQPDLDHWFYSDLTTKQKKLAREIWNIQ